MTETAVYDTNVLVYSSADLAARSEDDDLNQRLKAVERFLHKEILAGWNPKLKGEYDTHIPEKKNDLIVSFLQELTDRGTFVKSNKLQRHRWVRAKQAGWPNHDQHLLAVVDGCISGVVYTTENAHAICGAAIKRLLSIKVVKLPHKETTPRS